MDWKSNLVSLVLGLVLLGSGAWMVRAPWASADALAAARDADEKALARLVDVDRVSASLRAQLEADLDAVIADARSAPGAALDPTLAESLIGPAVDMLVQPAGIAMLMQGNVPKPAGAAAADAPHDTAAGYVDINSFIIRVTRREPGAQPVTLVLARQDSLAWKVVDIRLPHYAVASREELARAAQKPVEPEDVGVSQFDGDCVDARVAAFRDANGKDAAPTPAMMSGWLAECSQ